MDEVKYIKLCKKESNLILQKIICPNCDYVYSEEESVDLGIGSDCEDTVCINCKKCNKKLEVTSWVTVCTFHTRLAKEFNKHILSLEKQKKK